MKSKVLLVLLVLFLFIGYDNLYADEVSCNKLFEDEYVIISVGDIINISAEYNIMDINLCDDNILKRIGNTIIGTNVGVTHVSLRYSYEGNIEYKNTYVYVVSQDIKDYDDYVMVGSYYYPDIVGMAPTSDIRILSSDESIMEVRGLSLYVKKSGSVHITVICDSVHSEYDIVAINQSMTSKYMTLVKGESSIIETSGDVSKSLMSYESSNSNVVSVDRLGIISANNVGTAIITVTIDDIKSDCIVFVYAEATPGIRAVQAGEKVVGSTYSQTYRMRDGYYDCSSFVWRMYKSIGYPLSDDNYAPSAAEEARSLFNENKYIATSYINVRELKPGDLIFYGGSKNGRYKGIYHVAMFYGYYSDNRNIIIHASDGVCYGTYSTYRLSDIVLIARPFN